MHFEPPVHTNVCLKSAIDRADAVLMCDHSKYAAALSVDNTLKHSQLIGGGKTGHGKRRSLFRLTIALVLLVAAASTASPREVRTISIDFPINSWAVDSSYSNNAEKIENLRSLINECGNNENISIDSMTVSGYASPDGPLPRNKELSLRRAMSLLTYLNKQCGVPDSLITLGENIVPWGLFRDMVSSSGYSWRNDALRIMSTGNDNDAADNSRRMAGIKRLDGGKAWEVIKRDMLPRLRSAFVVTTVISFKAPEPSAPVADDSMTELPAPAAQQRENETVEKEAPVTLPDAVTECDDAWRLSTNIPEWALLIGNISGEWDFACHWSANLSLHYGALDYFSSTTKFRTFILRPEIRWWRADSHEGFFAGAHLQMASYNFALSSWEYRIQDVDGKHPALGGGIGAGYRLPLGKSGRWSLEMALGAGIYHLEYNRYENRPNGQLVDTRSRTWAGIDNVAISIVYNLSTSKR